MQNSHVDGWLETLYRYGSRGTIAHMLLIERTGTRICRVKFQRSKLRTLPASPVFRCLQQAAADALMLVPVAHRELRDVAVEYFAMHWVRRLFSSGVYKSNDLTAKLGDKGDPACNRVRRMLSSLPVTRRYGFDCG